MIDEKNIEIKDIKENDSVEKDIAEKGIADKGIAEDKEIVSREDTDIDILDVNELTGTINDLNPKQSTSTIRKALNIVIPVVTVIILVCGALYIYFVNKEYEASKEEYDELANIAITVEFLETPTPNEAAEKSDEKPVETFRNLHIDFDALSEINPEVVGWIYIPTLDNLNYPVVQTTDNEHYTKYTFEGEKNGSGAIFMNSTSYADINYDFNTFIYGHNMKNGTMFGQLKRFAREEGLFETDPYIFYYNKNYAYKFRIFAYYVTSNGSDAYNNPYDEEQYDNYIEYIKSQNKYEPGQELDFSSYPKLLTLSTCAGVNTRQRTIVQAVLVDYYEIK